MADCGIDTSEVRAPPHSPGQGETRTRRRPRAGQGHIHAPADLGAAA